MALAACATPSPPPEAEPAAGTQGYQPGQDQVTHGLLPIRRVAPVYPPVELGMCPAPVDVQAQLIVDKKGRVSEVRVSDELQAGEQRRRYIDAVRMAASYWKFQPLEVDHWVKDPGGKQHLDREEQPFSQIYVFHFECDDGKRSTTIVNAPAT
ncbi:hypothetical protein [Dyella caseinilytica]|uniref:Lipoprotein n=1 Tax=Dyella caseinilytica TaxID=1849581 RepID=A0ABX7GUQ7_9GAMM|nr:hypothetical protein [Dyella caseinilytica]QRN53487.1 hypothetical protein ISN74_19070 [Dyella caseinilytica]GFZ86852.1 hypothetical protein GCM10011408_01730 [Dyella caseinilytica]